MKKRSEYVSEAMRELNPGALMAEGFEDAIIGWVANTQHPTVFVYDLQKCVLILMERDGTSEYEAREFLDFNTLAAYVGPDGPLFVEIPDAG